MSYSIPFKILTAEESAERERTENPYHIMDGKWGGWGSASWRVFPHIHPKNVFEHAYKHSKGKTQSRAYWWRVWDFDKQIWRKIKTSEFKKLPVLKQPPKPVSFNKLRKNFGRFPKVVFPIIRQVYPELISADLVSVQPMTGELPEHIKTMLTVHGFLESLDKNN